MAKQLEDKPLAELTEESRRHIDEMGAEMDRASDDLDAVEELGLDVSRLRERLEWSKRARKTILERLT